MIDFSGITEIMIPEGIVEKIASGTKVLWERPGLPSAYQQVEYIATDGNQYIDTGVLASNYPDGLEYVFSGCCTAKSSKAYDYLFGCLESGKRSGNVARNSASTTRIMIGGGGGDVFVNTGGSLNVDFTLTAKGSPTDIASFSATYNDSLFTRTSYSFTNTDMPSANIYLLAANINGNYYSSTSGPFTGKLYSFAISDMNGTPIRNFIPCYRKSDSVIGLYDTVGKQFYTNSGTGSFSKGANVEQ